MEDGKSKKKKKKKKILHLYESKWRQGNTLDDVHYIFATTTDKPATQLPPTEDPFHLHALRARNQILIWCSSHVLKPKLHDPTDHGWFEENELLLVFFEKEQTPTEMRDLTHLYYAAGDFRDGIRCTCLLAGLKCIEMCGYGNECPNAQPSAADFEDENYLLVL